MTNFFDRFLKYDSRCVTASFDICSEMQKHLYRYDGPSRSAANRIAPFASPHVSRGARMTNGVAMRFAVTT
ncbi:hypothetical protein JTE90_019377 [Oedothorax gibbosus]|uniref:Uncharacterized protein n=1 Tax=Oedothorax gibbosus TaxID=931172 RepID=A0AAV6U0B7_9ARAC|nr:hypothetical protein JTE90_019377 [Oedothorax gibbosus]